MFRRIVHKVDYNERLPSIVKTHCQKAVASYSNIDSEIIQRIVLRIFFDLLFHKEITHEDEELFLQATTEWKRHVAQKGDSDKVIKEKMVDRIMELVIESNRYDVEALMKEFSADKYETASMFMQPFIISPPV